MDSSTDTIEEFVKSDYRYGFVSDIETDAFAPGLDEGVVGRISQVEGRAGFHARMALEGVSPVAHDA